jgi:hypothetical protein
MEYQNISEVSLDKTIQALKENNFNVLISETKADVKGIVTGLLQENSEVMQMSSVTLDETGVSQLINESGKYKAIKPIVRNMGEGALSEKEKTRLASVPDYAVGSVHALTEKGEMLIASMTGSQIPAYTYGPGKVIFVVGIQKLVKDFAAGMKRVYDYVLPLESERAHKAYGVPGSSVNKMLIINKEIVPGRITVVIVKEAVGF